MLNYDKKPLSKDQYLDNKQFLEAIVRYKQEVQNAADTGQQQPEIPESCAIAIMQIAVNLARKRNFSGYSWIEDMIGDGIKSCIYYFGNFDPAKSSNPFAYFTQICYYAFVQRIEDEKKQLNIVEKLKEDSMAMSEFSENADGEMSQTVRKAQMEFYRNRHAFDEVEGDA